MNNDEVINMLAAAKALLISCEDAGLDTAVKDARIKEAREFITRVELDAWNKFNKLAPRVEVSAAESLSREFCYLVEAGSYCSLPLNGIELDHIVTAYLLLGNDLHEITVKVRATPKTLRT